MGSAVLLTFKFLLWSVLFLSSMRSIEETLYSLMYTVLFLFLQCFWFEYIFLCNCIVSSFFCILCCFLSKVYCFFYAFLFFKFLMQSVMFLYAFNFKVFLCKLYCYFNAFNSNKFFCFIFKVSYANCLCCFLCKLYCSFNAFNSNRFFYLIYKINQTKKAQSKWTHYIVFQWFYQLGN